MVYDIILVDGMEIKAWGENVDAIVKMLLHDDVFIVLEDEHSEMVTYIARERVSHIRFSNNMAGVVDPVR